jgi:dihydrodipicolinate synthase/N-acetylneuraminate lyase
MSATITRRQVLTSIGASVIAARTGAHFVAAAPPPKPLRGALLILHTPFTADGAVDWDDLTREALFVDRAGAQAVVWPQGSSSVSTLSKEERMRGMEVLAQALKGRRVAFILGVQGKDVPEMLEYTAQAERLAPDAVIAMPPTRAQSLDDYQTYFRALAGATRRPVIVQTSGGARNLVPPTEMIVGLARAFPHLGYVKEESQPLVDRMKAELAHRDVMKGIYCANLGVNWLYAMRLGLDGIITGNAMYADLFARIWQLHEQRKTDELRDAYGKFLLMRNINELVPGADLFIMKKRGLFKTTYVRSGPAVAGEKPDVTERRFSPADIEEIEYRFAALQPYLQPALAPGTDRGYNLR